MIDQAILDILMSGYGGGGGRAPNLPRTRELDMSGLGPDPADSPRGSSLQDMYDFLMTPRHRRERSSHGAITHYGPSRRASVSPDDQQAAEQIMAQMQADEAHKAKMGRVNRADQMMVGRGPEAGGTMTFGGQEATIGPKGPMTSEQRMGALTGGIQPDPILEAEVGRRATQTAVESAVRQNLQNAEDAERFAAKTERAFEEERYKYPQLEEYADIPLSGLVQMLDDGELPPHIEKFISTSLKDYKNAIEQKKMWQARADAVMGVGGGGGGGVQDIDFYLGEDGQMMPNGPR